MRLVLGLGDFSLDWFSQMERDGKYGGYSECSWRVVVHKQSSLS